MEFPRDRGGVFRKSSGRRVRNGGNRVGPELAVRGGALSAGFVSEVA